MAFKSFPIALGTSDTEVFTCPATAEAAAVLMVSNTSASARTYTLKFYKQATGETKTVLSGVSLAGNTAAKVPAPLTLEEGDKIIMSASAAGDVVVSGTITVSTAAPVATGFTPRGAWSSEATYARNDIVEKNGTSYISLQDANIDQDPETQTGYWMVNAAKGATGDGDLSAANNLSDLSDIAQARTNLELGTEDSPQFAGIELGHASDTTITRTAAGQIAVEGSNVLLAGTEGQSVEGGASVTPKNLGTISSGTITIDVSARETQMYTNAGNHTLAVGSALGSTRLIITNGSPAGTITPSSFDSVKGDAFTTTNGDVFRCFVDNWGTGKKWLFVERM